MTTLAMGEVLKELNLFIWTVNDPTDAASQTTHTVNDSRKSNHGM